AFEGWRMYHARHPQGKLSHDDLTYKLYISPACDALAEAFQTTLAALTELRVPAFKVGRDLYGVLRPDKFIAYFADWATLETAADVLRARLAGCPAHGVPFTAALDDTGLLAWGVDPPVADGVPHWWSRESWRLWVTNHLAVALVAARATPDAPVEPW